MTRQKATEDRVEIAKRARQNGFGLLVIERLVVLIRDHEEIFHTTSWARVNDYLDGYEMGLEARK